LLDKMNELCPAELRHDPHFHAAGLNAIPPGGWLDLHLDAERHPTTGYRRCTNLILFLDHWEPEWGGALELWGRDRCEVSIVPAAGRAVAFDCRETVHGVPAPTNPFGGWRRSLAVFWYDPQPERRRAQFMATPGGNGDGKDEWRAERSKSHL
jgi:Rps23 Pro-64 3,4-dihydroxylase Tpa1-like proline 4-hydroxylase